MEESITYCWNDIGVSGDSSCAELKTVIHCRNCSVYRGAGRTLLQRNSPEGYVEEWTDILAQDWQEAAAKAEEEGSTLVKKETVNDEIVATKEMANDNYLEWIDINKKTSSLKIQVLDSYPSKEYNEFEPLEACTLHEIVFYGRALP